MLQRYHRGNGRLPSKALHYILGQRLRQSMKVYCGCLLMSVSATSLGSQLSTMTTPTAKSSHVPFSQVIDKIYINIGDVFDTENPKEDNFLFRFANTLHINTRETVIRDIILFKSGDVLSMQILSESERLLRGQGFLYDAIIRPINIRPDKVDIQVFTKDVWTLTPGGNFRSEGGQNTRSYKIEESNFLGYGKRVNIRKKFGVNREERLFEYQDPNLLGSRHTLKIALSDNSDGQRTAIDFNQPFYAIEAKESYGVSWLKDDKADLNIDPNDVEYRFRHQDDFLESFAGTSRRLSKDRILRYTYGYTYDQHRYNFIPLGSTPPPGQEVPEDVRDSYPWVGVAYIENRFIKTKRINFLNKTEDINLGHDMNLRVGWTDKNLGALQNGVVLAGSYQYNAIIHKGALLSHGFGVDGRIVDGRWVNGLLSSKTRYYFKKDAYHTDYLSINLDYGRELSRDKQLVLGGDRGLRGYPLNLQRGNNRFLVTYEKRYYTDLHLFRLLYVAGVAFFDIGRVWDTGGTYSENQGVLKDIGIGARLSMSRTGTGVVLRIDLSVPLDGNDNIKKYQLNFKAASEF